MASIKLLGALAGASGQALDALKSRQDEEREKRKMRMLEELRRDTAVYLADYEEQLKSKRVDDKLSSFDPSTKEFVMRNSRGEEIGRRADAGMAEDHDFQKQTRTLTLDAQRANIDQSRASADSSRASAGYSRKAAAALDGAGSGGNSLDARAQELLYQNKATVDDLAKDVTPETINSLALNVVTSAAALAKDGRPVSMQELWNAAVEKLRTKAGQHRGADGAPKARWVKPLETDSF